LIARFVEDGRVELISQFASPLPMNVISHVLGVPPERRADFKAWSDDFMAAQNNADPAVQAAARAKIDDFFDDELTSRRKRLSATEHGQPLPDDALTSLLRATNEDGTSFANEQLLPLLLLLLVGGNETTTTMIGSLVRRLLEHDLWNAVAVDDRLLDAAIEESLRFDPPVLGLFRTARGEQVLHGVTIPDRAKVHGLYAAGNRDPEVWNDPNQFRLDRSPAKARQHLSFGAGIWVCPAAGVARMEASVAVRCLARRLPTARIDGPVERTDSFMMWGPKSLPIAWDA
jgi:cytochrome P450